jgi:malate dehydrogenase
MKSAPELPKGCITAMLRLDHNRATSMLAEKAGVAVADMEKVAVWGNHSPTMFADYRFATAAGKPLPGLINDEDWYRNTFLSAVGKRGAAIIDARGLSSAASAANAAIDHMRDWALGSNNKWVSMGLPSDGNYGVPEDIIFGVPTICANGTYTRVPNLPMDDFAKSRIQHTLNELIEERDAVAELLK